MRNLLLLFVLPILVWQCKPVAENLRVDEIELATPEVTVDNTMWKLTVLSGDSLTLEAVPHLSFRKGDQLSGSTGCNRFGSTYNMNDYQLTFDKLMKTKKNCDDLQEMEKQFLKALKRTSSYRISGQELLLFDKKSRLLMRLVAREGSKK